MQLADFLRLHLDRVTRVLDASGGTLDLGAILRLPDGVGLVRAEPGRRPDPDELVVLAMGPDRSLFGEPDRLDAALAALPLGGRGILLLGYRAAELPYERALGPLAANRCQLIQVASLDAEPILTAAAFARVEQLELPRNQHNEPLLERELGATEDDPLAVEIPLANAYVFADFVAEAVRSERGIGEAPSSGDPRVRKLDELEAELVRANQRIESLEESASLRLGRTIVRAAQSPRAAARLPIDIVRLWRERSRGRQRRTARPTRPASQPVAAGDREAAGGIDLGEARRVFSHSRISIGPRDRLAIAGILSRGSAIRLAPDAGVTQLLPHDAILVAERTEPDLILVEAAAFRPGQPWAYAGDPGAVERARNLVRLLDYARANDRPTVLWRNGRPDEAIGLVDLEPRFDLMLPEAGGDERLQDWTVGVQLALANPLVLPAERPAGPAFFGAWDQRASIPARLGFERVLLGLRPGVEVWLDDDAELDELPTAVRELVAGRASRLRPWDGYRGRAVVVGEPWRIAPGARTGLGLRVLEQLACGARVAAVTEPSSGSMELLVPAPTVDDLGAAVGDAVAAGPSSESERRAVLRTIWRDHATAVQLDALARRLWLRTDALAVRSVGVLAAPATADEAHQLVDDVLLQTDRPSQAVILAPVGATWLDGTAGALARASIDVETGIAGEDDRLPRLPRTAWVWPWAPGEAIAPPTLIDVRVAADCSGADAVGFGGSVSGPGPDGLARGRLIVRRSVLESDSLTAGPPDRAIDEALTRPGIRSHRLEPELVEVGV